MLFFLTFLSGVHCAKASTGLSQLGLSSLDSCIAIREKVDAKYENQIASLKSQLAVVKNDHVRHIAILYQLFQKYIPYQSDSARTYARLCRHEALAIHDEATVVHIDLRMALLLTTVGSFDRSQNILREINFESLPPARRYDYAIAAFWTYAQWGELTIDERFSEYTDSLRNLYLNKAIEYAKRNSVEWYFLKGVKAHYSGESPQNAIKWYNQALSHCKNQRLYSRIALAAAKEYKLLRNDDMYGHYLVLSAKTGILSSAKSDDALLELSTFILDKSQNNATLAYHYMSIVMNDAKFRNDRLRLLALSNNLPPVVAAYQHQLGKQKQQQIAFIILVIILAVGAIILYMMTRNRNKMLDNEQKLLEDKNSQLNSANEQLQDVNDKMAELNDMLRDSNRRREDYLHLFVDICAFTMNRITSYRNLVKRKVKANQAADLLHSSNSDRLADEDMAKFYTQFDKAFNGLYPDFVSEFSKLLEPDYKVVLTKDGSLSTGMRIFAFIRLGVTESSEIATLLSYSPHTIYNYRSAMKSHAIDKEHFEENVRNLCKIV